MATVPLLCNVCPNEPDFSDLSHLLTHVSSKGHLSHYHKTQLRGRSEHDARQKLDAYDRWYHTHHIEQLLSQRMSNKESRRTSRPDRAASAKPGKFARSRKTRVKSSPSPEPHQSPVKIEDSIDPQLAGPRVCPELGLGLSASFTHQGHGPSHQIYIPHMSEWQTNDLGAQHHSSFRTIDTHAGSHSSGQGLGSYQENDYFKTFVQSPTRTAYPDPSGLRTSAASNSPMHPDDQPGRAQAFRARVLFQDDHSDDLFGIDSPQSPVLKGVKWPGMSLFDSASLDAQRQRNQKKDESILEQMANNSVAVEQMEDIYWPDGTLKKRRLITGNVESSPSSQPPPVPKRRRARTTKGRPVLADLSTNGPTVLRKHGRKPKIPPSSSLTVDAKHRSASPPALLKGIRMSYDRVDDSEEAERDLPGSSPSIRPRRIFAVFEDNTEVQNGPKPRRKPRGRIHNPFVTQSHPIDTTTVRPCSAENPTASTSWYDQLRSNAMFSIDPAEDLENLSNQQRTTHFEDRVTEPPTPRVTQRYFSVTGMEESQFYDAMPPQMEFGGTAGPKYRGATLNPLNPFFRQPRFRPPFSEGLSPGGPRTGRINELASPFRSERSLQSAAK